MAEKLLKSPGLGRVTMKEKWPPLIPLLALVSFTALLLSFLLRWTPIASGLLGILYLTAVILLTARDRQLLYTNLRSPNDQDFQHGAYHGSDINLDEKNTGQVLTRTGDENRVFWKFEPNPLRATLSIRNLFKKPELVFLTPEGCEEFRISRHARIPATFVLLKNGEVAAEIVRRSILRNNYSIQCDGRTWIVRMPVFTIRFFGVSDQGQHVWILVGPSKRQWSILFERGADSPHLLASIVFIHRLWWCHS